MTAGYCPYDILRDPAATGLVAESFDGEFGRIHYVRSRDAAGPVTLLLHGIGGTWSSWTPLLQAAAADGVDLGAVIAVDLPGFGASENRLGTLDSRRVGAMLLDLVGRHSTAPVSLVGQSMGGYLAVDIAATCASRVARVTGLAASFRSILEVGRHPLRFAWRNPRPALGNVAFYAAARLQPSGRIAGRLRSAGVEPLFDRIVAHPGELRPGVAAALGQGFTTRNMIMAARNARSDESDLTWPAITATASFVWGSADVLVPPREADFVARILPAATRTVIADAGHIPHIEQPHRVLASLAR